MSLTTSFKNGERALLSKSSKVKKWSISSALMRRQSAKIHAVPSIG